MTMKTLNKADLRYFTGTETWYRHGLAPKVLYTEGVKYVADNGGAYWLIDEIAFNQFERQVSRQEFQHWKLKVSPDQTAILTCEDGNNHSVFIKNIEYTDFPLDEIAFYYTGSVIMLPSEY